MKSDVVAATKDLKNMPRLVSKEVRNAVKLQVERLQAQVEKALDMNQLLTEAFDEDQNPDAKPEAQAATLPTLDS